MGGLSGGAAFPPAAGGPNASAAPAGGGVASSVSAALVCCLALTPCSDDVTCRTVHAPGGCRALAEAHLPLADDKGAWICNKGPQRRGPSWDVVIYPFFYIPLAALLAMSLLWRVLRPLYFAVAKRSRFRKLIMNHIGCRDHPYPRNVDFMVWITWMQIVLSLLAMGVFVFKTYAQSMPAPVRWLDGVMGIFLTFHFFVFGVKNEFHADSLLDTGQLVDVFTVPGMMYSLFDPAEDGRGWLSLGFLRLVPALLAYERLCELGALGRGGNEIVQHLVRMAFRFLAFVVCFASFVLIFEVLGDPLQLHGVHIATGMGQIDYFTVAYWIVETISLVGYGDFTPTTVLSRFVTILTMISGFAVFTFELGKILSIIDKGKRGAGSYSPTSREHVVLVGGGVQNLDETFMTAFLDELYHISYRNTWPDLILMTTGHESLTKARDLFGHNLGREARQHVTFLDGSLLNEHDLKRCGCHGAKLVWIIADTTGASDPFDEDKENILRALSLSVRCPSTPMMLMLLTPESKSKALSVGIPRQRCFCLNEIKSGLFWQSCRCVGLNSMLSNLMVTTEAEVHGGQLIEHPWLENYVDGMGHEVYGLLAADEFLGKPLIFLIEEAYTRNRICIFAAQVDGIVVLAPMRRLKHVRERTVLFALAQDELMLHGIASRSGADWKAVFLENSVRLWKRQAAKEEVSKGGDREAAAKMASRLSKGFYRQTTNASSASGYNRHTVASSVAGGGDPSPAPRGEQGPGGRMSGIFAVQGWRAGADVKRRRSAAAKRASRTSVASSSLCASWGLGPPNANHFQESVCALDHVPTAPAADIVEDSLERELEERTANIRRGAPTAPFVLVLEFSGSWDNVVSFVLLSRRKYLPFQVPIVILCPAPPTAELEAELDLRKDVGLTLVWGNPHVVRDLHRAGVNECSIVVGLGQSIGHASGEMAAMLDSDVVMIYRMLERMHRGRTNMIFEFNRTDSMWLLPIDQAGLGAVERETEQDEGRTMLEVSYLDPRFASGRVFAPQALGSLLAHCFHTPGIVEVMQCLVTPEEPEGLRGVGTNMPWQLRLRTEHIGMSYGDVLLAFIQDSMHPVLPIGIYRCFESKAVPGNRGYVWTNPPKDTILLETDLLYVLGDASFGQLAHTADLMPMGPPGLTNLMSSRAGRITSR